METSCQCDIALQCTRRVSRAIYQRHVAPLWFGMIWLFDVVSKDIELDSLNSGIRTRIGRHVHPGHGCRCDENCIRAHRNPLRDLPGCKTTSFVHSSLHRTSISSCSYILHLRTVWSCSLPTRDLPIYLAVEAFIDPPCWS
jgi:hypothetical protein